MTLFLKICFVERLVEQWHIIAWLRRTVAPGRFESHNIAYISKPCQFTIPASSTPDFFFGEEDNLAYRYNIKYA